MVDVDSQALLSGSACILLRVLPLMTCLLGVRVAVSEVQYVAVAPGSATRGHRYKVLHHRAETRFRTRSFAMQCVQSWNALPDRVVAETNLGKFKGMLANCLGDALFAYLP